MGRNRRPKKSTRRPADPAAPARRRSGGRGLPARAIQPRASRRPGRAGLIIAGAVALLAVAGAIGVALLAGPGQMGGQTSGPRGGIVYSDSERIWLVEPAGGNRGRDERGPPRRLAGGPAAGGHSAFTPRGRPRANADRSSTALNSPTVPFLSDTG